MTTTRVHFLGTIFANMAACGRYVGAGGRPVQHSDQREQVTCLACLKVLR